MCAKKYSQPSIHCRKSGFGDKHNVVGCRLLVDPLSHDISGKVGLDIFVRLYLFLRF